MSLLLQVDAARWTKHLANVQRAFPGIVPVIKGNGYGFGQVVAAEQAGRLGVRATAVGVVSEIADVAAHFPGDVVVLEPWDPSYSVDPERLPASGRLVLTASRLAAVRSLARIALAGMPVQVLFEGLTSMHRFGMSSEELADALAEPEVVDAIASGRLRVAGLSLHLPMTQPEARNVGVLSADGTSPATGRVREVLGWCGIWSRARHALAGRSGSGQSVMADTVWVSHLAVDEVAALHRLVPKLDLRHRIGTRLWLGDPLAFAAGATVLSVDELGPGSRVGYRQRKPPRGTRLVVASGGTSHGIAMTAPSPVTTIRQRVVTAGTGALDATGRALSPFRIGGKRLWFAEPPHAQVSMLWQPTSQPAPHVGDLLDVEVRMTTVRFDEVVVAQRPRPAP